LSDAQIFTALSNDVFQPGRQRLHEALQVGQLEGGPELVDDVMKLFIFVNDATDK
jgi:hypothetical protein